MSPYMSIRRDIKNYNIPCSSSMTMVSVIIPTYNCATYITEAIDSALAQTYKDYEIVVVDDGSTDNTREVLGKYIENGLINYIYQSNQGVVAARNATLRAARGEYVAFLDADDMWEPNKLELQMRFLAERPDVALLHGNIRIVDADKNKTVFESLPISKRHKSDHIFEELYLGNFINTSTVVIKRECLDKVGHFDTSLRQAEDYDLWMRLAAEFKCGFQDVVMGTYRVHGTNTSKNNIQVTEHDLKVLNKMKSLYPTLVSSIPKEKIKERFFKKNFSLGYGYFCQYDLVNARKYFLSALKYKRNSLPSYIYILSTYLNRDMIDKIRIIKRKTLSLQKKESSP